MNLLESIYISIQFHMNLQKEMKDIIKFNSRVLSPLQFLRGIRYYLFINMSLNVKVHQYEIWTNKNKPLFCRKAWNKKLNLFFSHCWEISLIINADCADFTFTCRRWEPKKWQKASTYRRHHGCGGAQPAFKSVNKWSNNSHFIVVSDVLTPWPLPNGTSIHMPYSAGVFHPSHLPWGVHRQSLKLAPESLIRKHSFPMHTQTFSDPTLRTPRHMEMAKNLLTGKLSIKTHIKKQKRNTLMSCINMYKYFTFQILFLCHYLIIMNLKNENCIRLKLKAAPLSKHGY